MLAAARAEKAAPAAPAAKPKPASAKPAAAKASPKPPAKVKPGSQAMDTASILAAARKADQPGPITKAEAAKRQMAPPKKKITAPVMPEKPAYALAPAAERRHGNAARFYVGLLRIVSGRRLHVPGRRFGSVGVGTGTIHVPQHPHRTAEQI